MSIVATPRTLLRLTAMIVATAFALLAPAAAHAATNTFQGPGNDWNTAANWSQNSVPDATDDVIIPPGQNPGLSAGADGVANSIDLDGQLRVQNGRSLTVGAGVSSFDGLLFVRDQGAKLRLNGTTTWSAGGWSIGGTGDTATAGGLVENAGTLNVTADTTAGNAGSGQMANLAGATINRTTSSGPSDIQPPIDNDGAINANTGTLQLRGGTPSGQQSTGDFTAAAGATLSFAGGHSVGGAGSSVGGAGSIELGAGVVSTLTLAASTTYNPAATRVAGGFLSLAGSGTTTALTSIGAGGGMSGPGTLSVGNGASSLNEIVFQGTGTTNFSPTSTIAATGNVSVRDQGTKLHLEGTTNWSAGTWLVGGTGTTGTAGGLVENAGTINVTANTTAFNQGSGQLANLAGATLNRTTSGGTANIQVPIDNDGAINANSGMLRLGDGTPSGQQSGGDFTAAGGSTLAFAGSHSVGGAGSSVGGAGTIELQGVGTQALTLAATTTYNPATTHVAGGFLSLAGSGTSSRLTSTFAGGMNGPGTLAVGAGASTLDGITFRNGGTTSFAPGASISATGPVNVENVGTTLRLNGTTTWSAGNWNVQGDSGTATPGGLIENAGTLNVTGNTLVTTNGGFVGRVNNLAGATINRTTSSGTADFQPPIENDGAISVQAGTLRLQGGTPSGAQSNGTFTAAAGATLSFVREHSIAGVGSSVGGAGTVQFEGGTTTLASNTTYNPATTHTTFGFLALAGTGTTTTLTSAGDGGMSGAGTLNVGNGSSVLNGIRFLGGGTTNFSPAASISASGNVVVSGQGSKLHLDGTTTYSGGAWNVGGGSPAGGLVENAGILNLAVGNVGTIWVDNGNGRLTNLSGAAINRTASGTFGTNLPVDNAGAINVNTGELQLSHNAPSLNQTAGTTQVASGATLTLNVGMTMSGGVLKGTGTVNGSVSNTGGTVQPGASPGILTITGNYTQGPGGTLNVEVNGDTPGTEFDQLDVGGAASLDGTLDIDNGAGHDPAPADTFKIVKSGSRTGTFSTVTGATTLSGDTYDVTYQADGATLVVQGAPPPPDVSIDDVTVTEGDSGTTTATFTVTRSSTTGGNTTVNYATANGTASAGSDYTGESGTVTFTGTQTTRTITVDVTGDTRDEPNETFFVNLSGGSNANITDGQGRGTITDDDPTPSLSIGNRSVTEGDSGTTNASFTVSLSAASGRTVTVDYATANGSASAPSDYTAESGTVTFAPGQTTRTISIAVRGDGAVEGDETYSVGLSNPANATIADATGTGTIVNDDVAPPPPPPNVSIGDASVNQGDSGFRDAAFEVSLSRPSQDEVTVGFETNDGSATSPGDYSQRSGDVTFAPGQTRRIVRVPVRGDTRDESNETFEVELDNGRGATIRDRFGRGTIRDDDDPAPPPPPPPPTGPACDGRPATIVGTFAAEEIVGTPGADVILSRGGADEIDARGGDDRVCGGDGADDVRGGAGDDRLFGQGGADKLDGGEGADLLNGADGADRLFGRAGADRLIGGAHEDLLFGGSGRDRCTGGGGQDSSSGCEG